jgi:uncharacterized protein (DUF427 family)
MLTGPMRWPAPDPVGPGQESVWDYPRPPRLESITALLEVVLGGVVVASTTDGWRVLETSHPPTYYLPRAAFLDGALRPAVGSSFCEWKGYASYFDVVGGGRVAAQAAWTYERPTAGFAELAGAVAVMAAQVDECRVDGERVSPQPGGFYGGWITPNLAGPFKGIPGSMGW